MSDNLEYIRKEIDFLHRNANKWDHETQTKKAVVCYDLGEFARFYAHGRDFCKAQGAKDALQAIFSPQDSKAIPDLKKEAISAYQKILMDSYGR